MKPKQKEYPVVTGSGFTTIYGCFDVENPKTLYIQSKAKITPLEDKRNYAEEIRNIKSSFVATVSQFFEKTSAFSSQHLCTCDVSENNIAFGKISNLKYEVVVRPLEKKMLKEYYDDVHYLTEYLCSNLKEEVEMKNFQIC